MYVLHYSNEQKLAVLNVILHTYIIAMGDLTIRDTYINCLRSYSYLFFVSDSSLSILLIVYTRTRL